MGSSTGGLGFGSTVNAPSFPSESSNQTLTAFGTSNTLGLISTTPTSFSSSSIFSPFTNHRNSSGFDGEDDAQSSPENTSTTNSPFLAPSTETHPSLFGRAGSFVFGHKPTADFSFPVFPTSFHTNNHGFGANFNCPFSTSFHTNNPGRCMRKSHNDKDLLSFDPEPERTFHKLRKEFKAKEAETGMEDHNRELRKQLVEEREAREKQQLELNEMKQGYEAVLKMKADMEAMMKAQFDRQAEDHDPLKTAKQNQPPPFKPQTESALNANLIPQTLEDRMNPAQQPRIPGVVFGGMDGGS